MSTPPPTPPPPSVRAQPLDSLKASELAERLDDLPDSPKKERGFTLTRATRRIRRNINTRRPDREPSYSIQTFDGTSFTIGGRTIVLPPISFVNYTSDQRQVLTDVVAVINHALATGAPEAAVLIDFLSRTQANGYTSFLSISSRDLVKGNSGDGGQAHRPLRQDDTELETAVYTQNIGTLYQGSASLQRLALIERAFHEFGHSLGEHFRLNTRFSLNSAEALRSIRVNNASGNQINFLDLDTTYAFGRSFLIFLRDYARTHDTITVDGRVIDIRQYRFSDTDINTYYYGGSVGGSQVTGVLSGAAELYENNRILAVSGKLREQFRRLANNQPLTDEPNATRLGELDRAGYLELKQQPNNYDAAANGPWGSRLSHYRQTRPGLVDYDGDGNNKQSTGNAVSNILSAAQTWDVSDAAVQGLIAGLTVVDLGQLGLALGSVLGKRLTDDPFAQVLASGTLSTALGAIGEFIQQEIFNSPTTTEILKRGFDSFGDTLVQNIKGAGIGALSSYLTSQLVSAIGLEGLPGEVVNSVGGAVIGKILSNLAPGSTATSPFAGINASLFVNAIGSFIGSKLASEIKTFETVGGQIGSQVGAIYGGFASTVALAAANGLALGGASLSAIATNAAAFAAAQPILAVAIVAAVVLFDTLLGGFIGSVFGGTPRSGADTVWDEAKNEFTVANIYSRKGGSKETAKALAGAVAGGLNAALSASGSKLVDGSAVGSGNYGMRKSDFVYRPVHTRDKDAITARFSGKDAAQRLVTHGTYIALSSMIGQMAGGDIYVKRAIVSSLANAGGDPSGVTAGTAGAFSLETLLGDVSVATSYQTYLDNSFSINMLIASDGDTSFAASWLVSLSRAAELGLGRRSYTDWIGGYDVFLDEAADGTLGGTSLTAAHLQMGLDPSNGLRFWAVYDGGPEPLGYVEDTIEAGTLTQVSGTNLNDKIVLTGNRIAAASSTENSGITVDGAIHGSSPVEVPIAATVDGGDGDDEIHGSDRGDNLIGGAGNDDLYGGKLDDWLLGGEGKDRLYAGAAGIDPATGKAWAGGHGNYLDGGSGNDELYGREGSDWLEGGDGADLIEGGGGDDILAGGTDGVDESGAPKGDTLKGGHGDDQYLVRLGDGKDMAEETAEGAVLRNSAPAGTDRVKARFDGILANLIAKNWRGDRFDIAAAAATGTAAAPVVAAAAAGGEDAIVFGPGIGIADIRLMRTNGELFAANGADLRIDVMTLNEAGTATIESGTRIIVKDWFADPFKRIEWLKFADGTEIRLGDVTSFVAGTEGDDVIIGTEGNDFVYAGSGNDRMHLLGGRDIGIGAAGDDVVAGDGGRDLLIGGIGNDQLIGGEGEDSLSGDAGNDDLYGGTEDDILSGGRGDDQVVGGAGDDTFKFARGDGRDTIFDEFADFWVAVWSAGSGWGPGFNRNDTTGEITGPDGSFIYKNIGTFDDPNYSWFGRFNYSFTTNADGTKAGTLYRYDQAAADAAGSSVANLGTDTIEFAIGISIQDVILTRVAGSNDLVLTIATEDAELASYADASDSITIRNWYLMPGQIERFAFYQTGVLTVGGAGGYSLTAGDDLANGTNSAPLIGSNGGAGKDWITGGAGSDTIAGGADDDILAGNGGSDTLRGEAGKDVLYGGAGNDILEGGADADILIGGAGLDAASYSSSGTVLRAYLGHAWANTGAAEGDVYDGIENLVGGIGGSTTTRGDVLGGDDGENEITGGRGNDRLLGGGGNDTYVWNSGDWGDVIREGRYVVEQAVDKDGVVAAGFAVSIWAPTQTARPDNLGNYWRLQVTGPGGEVVYDHALYAPDESQGPPAAPLVTAWIADGWKAGFERTAHFHQVTREKIDTTADGGDDAIEFGPGVGLSDLTFERWTNGVRNDSTGLDLLIRFRGIASEYVLIQNQYAPGGGLSPYGAVETLLFRDGLAVSLAQLIIPNAGGTAIYGTDQADFISQFSTTSADTFYGGAGNDILVGGGGRDLLDGGAGDDILEGGALNDRIYGGETDETVGDTVRYTRSGAVWVDLRRIDQLATYGGDAAGDMLYGIENVVGSQTGGDFIDGDDEKNRIDGLDGNNRLYGWGGDDVVTAGGGNDMLFGGDGDDNVSGGEGLDKLWGGSGTDTLTGGADADMLYGEAGDDTLLAGDGDDSVVDGGDGADKVYGEAGNDVLTGGAGDDLIDGGSGNDILAGGDGNDRYFFASGFGVDTLNDSAGVNKILFDAAIPYDRLWLTTAGEDLKIAVLGTPDIVTVTGFFAAGTGRKIRSIETKTHAIYIADADVDTLIEAMTLASVAGMPKEMPAAIKALLATYWHAGGGAAPRASATAQSLSGPEDTVLSSDGGWGVVNHDGDSLTYSLAPVDAPANGTVAITDPATGALTYTPRADFYGSDSFTLIVKDAAGKTTSVVVSVTLTPLADRPRDLAVLNGAELAIAEAAPASATGDGSEVGRLSATDAEGGAIKWTIATDGNGTLLNDGGRFAVSEDGIVTVLRAALLDRETNASHRIWVRATDDSGLWTERSFDIAILDANDQNSLEALAPITVPENMGPGVVVADANASDQDLGVFGKQRYFFLSNGTEQALSPDGLFAIDEVTGEIRTAGTFNREGATQLIEYTVVARDNDGAPGSLADSKTLRVTIGDVNEGNWFEEAYDLTVNEGAAPSSFIVQVGAKDADEAGTAFATQRYYFLFSGSISDTSFDGRYKIEAETGIVRSILALDREQGEIVTTYKLLARDNPDGTVQRETTTDLKITIGDVNEGNSIDPEIDFAVEEGTPVGTEVHVLTAEDGDSEGLNAQQVYAFLRDGVVSDLSHDGRFRIHPTTGSITVAATIDRESFAEGHYEVVVRDRGGQDPYSETSTLLTIAVGDRNDPNSLPPSYSFTVDENLDAGAPVGQVEAADEDAPGTEFAKQKYAFEHGGVEDDLSHDGLFRIDRATGAITTTGTLNRESFTGPLAYRVVARDKNGAADGNSVGTDVFITVTDVNEKPDAPQLLSAPAYVSERTGWTAQFRLTDPDAGDSIKLVFSQNLGDRFELVGTDVLRFKDGLAPSFETLFDALVASGSAVLRNDDSDELSELLITVKVKAQDRAGLTSDDETVVTVRVEDVNEAPTGMTWELGTSPVSERDRVPAGTPKGAVQIATFTVADEDLDGELSGSYLFSAADARFTFINNTLWLRADTSLDYEALGPDGILKVTITATDRMSQGAFSIQRTIDILVKDEIDILNGSGLDDILVGQRGRDEIHGWGGKDNIKGGLGNDDLFGDEGDDTIMGEAGDDLVRGGDGNDDLKGNDGIDSLYGDAGADVLDGGPLGDFLYGGTNPAKPQNPAPSDKWQDELYGDAGDDHLYGEGGDDMLVGGYGADRLDGGEGDDTADYMYTDTGILSTTAERVTVSLANPGINQGAAAGDTYHSVENVRGSRGNDLIYGDAGDNILEGGEGDDVIHGGDGADTLDGGAGDDTLYADNHNDVLIGGAGADTMWGGDGSDTYIVTRTSGADTIHNFDRSTSYKDTLAFKNEGGPDIKDHEIWFEKVIDAQGEHVRISLLGTGTSATIRNWSAGVLYQIDFITAGSQTYTRNIDVAALVGLMHGKSKPLSGDAHLAVLSGDPAYKDRWATLWHTNAKPTLATTDPLVVTIAEGSTVPIKLTLWDDITPNDRIEVRATSVSGNLAIASTSLSAPDADGRRTLTIVPVATSSGTSDLVLKAYDLSGNESDLGLAVRVTATPKPNTPTLSAFSSPGGTSGEAGGIPIAINVDFPDKDGSEEQAIGFANVPVAEGVSFNKGWYDPAFGLWLVWKADLDGLALVTPAGFHRDLAITATAYTRENGQVAASASITTTIAINAPPTGASFEGTVRENMTNGTLVGIIKGVDPDPGDVLTYEHKNPTGSAFSIATDGTVRILNASLLNHEQASSLTVVVKVKDATRFKDDISITIPVQDVNEQNYFDLAARTVTHDETVGTSVLIAEIKAKDPDSGSVPFGKQVYGFLVGGVFQQISADELFSIDKLSGEIRARTGLSYETMKSRDYEVAARDNEGNPGYKEAVQTLTIKLNDVNEPNRFTAATYSKTVLESEGPTASVLSVLAEDDDLPTERTGKQVYGFWWDNQPKEFSQDGRYRMNAGTGEITVAAALNHEQMAATVTYKVVARDNGGVWPYNQIFADASISVGDVNEANSFGAAQTFVVNENTAQGVSIGSVTATDPDGGVYGQQEYSFVIPGETQQHSHDNRYLIDKTSGAITINQAFSYEPVQSDRTYEVIARDNPTGGGIRNTARTLFTVRVADVNEANSLEPELHRSVLENSAGAYVATIAASDLDTPGTPFADQVYSFLVNGAYDQESGDKRYQIDLISGIITTKFALDHETMAGPVEYIVEARDNRGAVGGNTARTVVKISVGNVAETPDVPVGPAQAYFDEAPAGANPAAPGRVFATYALRDGDGTVPTLQFAAGGNPGNYFTISGNQVVFGANYDFEYLRNFYPAYDYNGDGRLDLYIGDVKVVASDGSLTSTEAVTRFYLSDVNERPNNTAPISETPYSEIIPGDAQHAGNPIATFSMSDPDGAAPSLRILAGNDYGWFTTEGGTLKFAGANFTAQWLRDTMGTHGQDAGFYYDRDGDGLKEVRVATLTLAAVDASGLMSDPIAHNVLIEDKNEAPAFTQAFSFAPFENAGWYQQVGSLAASDPDGDPVDLRYLFANQGYYYDGSLGRWVSASGDGKFLVDLHDGRVWVNGIQTLDFEGQRTFNYQTVVHDRAMGAYSLSGTGSLTISLQDVNEPHSLIAASFTVNEASVPLGPMIPVPTTSGQAINLRTAMLSDPEGRNMRWQFSNGSTVMNGWQIEQDGTLRMLEAVDYEALAPVGAVITLGVQAIDDYSGAVTQANVTLTIADVNEDVTVSSYANYQVYEGYAWVQQQSTNVFWVKGEILEGRIISVNASDPERQTLSYSLTNVSRTDLNIYWGDASNDIDSAHPILSIDGYGTISFYLPYGSGGSKDIAWQGGTRTSANGRRAHSIEYSFDVVITDPTGRAVTVPYKVSFIRRGWSAPPIVLDLDGDGLELVDFQGSTVTFDMDEDGIRDVTGWVGADDGLLALDRNGDGTINDFSEISFKRDEEGAYTDLEGLRAFDTNANGFLDGGDERWSEFRIWRDLNQDGVSQEGELVSLVEAGIANINLTLTLTGQSPENAIENVVYGTTRYQRSDGSFGTVGDVFLAFDPSNFEKMAAPIVLDYDGDGSGLVSISDSTARFDMDGDGKRDRTGWIARGDALLALDRNGDGEITDIAEISFVGDLPGATTDLEGLAAFDTDGDGMIGTHDERFGDFRLWFDNDGNGVTDAGELLTLAQAGIASISLGGVKLSIDEQAGGGNRVHGRSTFTREDGTTGGLLDAAFAFMDGEDGPIVGHSGWNGGPTPSTTAPVEAPVTATVPDPAGGGAVGTGPSATNAASEPALPFHAQAYRGGSGKYRLSAQGGELVVGRSKAKGVLDPRAGAVGPAAMLSFGKRTVGYLAPLVLDLDGDGAEIRSRRKSDARFDMDGDGSADDSGWIGRGDGFLVIDSNGNGLVDSPAELSLLGLKPGARNSFEALAALDSNRNGRIDSGDARFGELRVWADANGNGVTDQGELRTLTDHGIASIDLAARATEQSVKIGANAVIATGSFTRTDGSVGSVADAALAFRPGGAAAAPAGLDATLRALRSGGGEGLRQSLADLEASAADGGLPVETMPGGDPRLAYMLQQMAAFGPRPAEECLHQRQANANDRYDYFAA